MISKKARSSRPFVLALAGAALLTPGTSLADGAGLFTLPVERTSVEAAPVERPTTSILGGLVSFLVRSSGAEHTRTRATVVELRPFFSGLQGGGIHIRGSLCDVQCDRATDAATAAPERRQP